MKYVRSLDGIRGVAVLLVIFFHYGYLGAGWVGVQIFFTLSGYLITTILVEDRVLPFRAYVGRFYWRRALRILPLYLAFVCVMAVSFALVGLPRSFRGEWPYLFTYTANFGRIPDADLGPYTVHLWSLAVEEQFYFIWPFLLYLLPPKRFKAAIAAILVLSPAVRLALFLGLMHWGHDAQYAGKLAYVMPFTQFDAFAAGAAIPLWGLGRLKHAGALVLAALGLTGALGFGNLLAAHFFRGGADKMSLGYPLYMVGSYQYVWGYSLLNILSALGIICAIQKLPQTKALENPALVRVGKVSYGVYVYHLPILQLGVLAIGKLGLDLRGVPRGLFFVVYVAVVLAVSEASFRWIEGPFLKHKDFWNGRKRAGAAQDVGEQLRPVGAADVSPGSPARGTQRRSGF